VVLRVLQRMVYLRETGWEPDRSWGGFVKQALRDEYTFDYDERYQAWLSARLRGYRVPVHVDARRLSPPALERYAPDASPEDSSMVLAGAAVALPDRSAADADAATSAPELESFEDTLWGRVRRRLAELLPAAVYQPWIKPLESRAEPISTDARLVLDAPDAFAADWVRQKHAPTIAAIASAAAGRPIDVVIEASAPAATRLQQREA
jgi:hypothetical protein